MDEGREGDRLSDLNCFWMAHDPQYPDDIFKNSAWRNGIFGRYYSLKLYYVGYGGNSNTTTRFRIYDGNYLAFDTQNIRPPIQKEYTDAAHLLKPNHWYSIRIVCKGNRTWYYHDGELLFHFTHDAPYKSGWFGFRTTESRVKLTQFRIKN
jgi:rhamnogalacturonan endolyase